MVDDSKIEEWIQGKLDDGIEPERIKKSLENTGHDPSLVDDIQDPFSGEDTDVEEPDFVESSDEQQETDTEESEEEISQDEEPEQVQQVQTSNIEQSSDKSRFSLPEISFSVPSVPRPDFNWKKMSVIILTLLIASAGGLVVFTGVVSAPEFSSIEDTVMNAGGSGDCPDVETSIMSSSISDGKTWMKVEISGGSTNTITEIFNGEEMVASKQKTIQGVSVVIVDGVGTRAVFRPVGCAEGDEVSLT